MFQKLYNSIFTENLTIRSITWTIIVIINAIPGFILAGDFSILGKICGIITWILIYIFIYPFFGWGNTNGRKSVCISYLIHTLTSIFIVMSYGINYDVYGGLFLNEIAGIITGFDLIIGIISINIVEFFLGFSESGLISTYLITMLHGGILSIILLFIAFCIFGILELWKHILCKFQKGV